MKIEIEHRVDVYLHQELGGDAARKLDQLLTQGVKLMDGFADLKAANDALVAAITRVLQFIQNTVPAQIAAAVAAATAGDQATAEATAQSLTAEAGQLAAAVQAAIPPGSGPPPVVTGLAASYPDLASFNTALALVTGPDEVTLDGAQVRAGTAGGNVDAYFTHSDSTPPGLINQTGPTS